MSHCFISLFSITLYFFPSLTLRVHYSIAVGNPRMEPLDSLTSERSSGELLLSGSAPVPAVSRAVSTTNILPVIVPSVRE